MFEDAGLPQEIDLRESGRETCVELGVKGGWQEPMQPSCVGILGQAGNETIAASLIAGLIVVPMKLWNCMGLERLGTSWCDGGIVCFGSVPFTSVGMEHLPRIS